MLNIFDIAASGMTAQTVRMNVTASNIANAESVSSSIDETYKARHPVFSQMMTNAQTANNNLMQGDLADKGNGVQVIGIVESEAPYQQRYQPDHPYANEEGYVAYPNVNIMEEMANMMSASRSFQTNAEVMNTTKQMMQRVLTLGQ